MHTALNSAILDRVVAAVRTATFPAGVQITAATRFGADLGFDSLDVLEVAMCLEEAFDIEFTRDTVARFTTVADVVAYLSQRYFRDIGHDELVRFDASPARPPPSTPVLVRRLEPARP